MRQRLQRLLRGSAAADPPQFHYRPDIDGLRALAVLSVVLFHFDAQLLPGGFTGVDIFLVISGFLITSILRREMAAGDFSFRRFYLRRIRRIAPAYFAIAVATLLAGCFLLAPDDLEGLGRSAFWSALSLPNVHFWQALDTGYFAADSRQLPLLHLWSLGVEEQFYFVWPTLLLLGMRGLPRWTLLPLLGMVTLGSFAYAQQQLDRDPAFAYYMLPTRAGELGLGAMLALGLADTTGQRTGGFRYEWLAAAGLALIAGGLFLLDGASAFPGWNALYPCLGTGLLIFAGARRDCWITAPFRWAPVVWIGLMSYSLYLWHWPVLAFLRYFDAGPDTTTLLYAALLIGLLTLASYYLIEKPCRRLRSSPARQAIALYVLPTLTLLALSWLVMSQSARLGARGERLAFERAERDLQIYTAPAFDYPYNCQLSTFDPAVLSREACVHGRAPGNGTRALLWGDSHAAHYIGVVATLAERQGFQLRNASYSTCPPILSGENVYGGGIYREGCTRFRALISASINQYDLVFMGAQWNAQFNDPGFEADLGRTLDRLVDAGKTVYLLGEAPAFESYDRKCEIRNLRHAVVDCRALSSYPYPGMRALNRKLQDLAAARRNTHYLDVDRVICPNGICSPYLDERPIYYDRFHLSMEGSWLVGRKAFAGGASPPRR